MQAFVVRPVIVGLLALIAAGLWSGPFGTRGRNASNVQTDCRAAPVARQAPTLLAIMIRRGVRC
jgi:hypothetical protein